MITPNDDGGGTAHSSGSEGFGPAVPARLREYGTPFIAKVGIARALDLLRVNRGMLHVLHALRGEDYIRIVNYHSTPRIDAARIREHFAYYAANYVPAGRCELQSALAGNWVHSRPGLMITFDDGMRCNYDVALPILREFGFQGWFFPPVGFVNAKPSEQAHYASANRIPVRQMYADGRLAMSWPEIERIADAHEIGCHTYTHRRFSADLGAEALEFEVGVARAELAKRVGRDIDSFCWVGGEEAVYQPAAAEAIRAAGYRYGFMTNSAPVDGGTDPLQLQRTNIESWWPLSLVRFQLSGAVDALYAGKRRRVNARTSAFNAKPT